LTNKAISESSTPSEQKLSHVLPDLFPAVFGSQPAALKIGIHTELLDALEGRFSTEAVSRYLKRHVLSSEYLGVVATGGMRMTLAGIPVEVVTPEQQTYAKQQLEHRRLKQEGLLQPREKDALDYRGRFELIKKVKASGLRLGKYAKANGMDVLELEKIWCKAIDEQRERHARRTKLLLEFEQSTMSQEQFASYHDIDVSRLARELEKARGYRASEKSAESHANSNPANAGQK